MTELQLLYFFQASGLRPELGPRVLIQFGLHVFLLQSIRPLLHSCRLSHFSSVNDETVSHLTCWDCICISLRPGERPMISHFPWYAGISYSHDCLMLEKTISPPPAKNLWFLNEALHNEASMMGCSKNKTNRKLPEFGGAKGSGGDKNGVIQEIGKQNFCFMSLLDYGNLSLLCNQVKFWGKKEQL